MSSQTTDTPGTTTTRNPAATRSGATSQTYPTPGHKANPQFSLRTTHPGTSPTQKPAHHKGEPFPGRSTRGLAAIFPHQRRRLRKQYTPPTPTANPPSAGSTNPNLALLLGSAAIICQCRTWSVEKHFYGVAHIVLHISSLPVSVHACSCSSQ